MRATSLSLLLSTLLFVGVSNAAFTCTVPGATCNAVAAWYTSNQAANPTSFLLGGDSGWQAFANGSTTNYCSLSGITCESGTTYVTQISFANTLMAGGIPSSVGDLTNLTKIDVHSTLMSGAIPTTALFSLPKLTYLDLSATLLSGSLPNDFVCGNFTYLSVAGTFIPQNAQVCPILFVASAVTSSLAEPFLQWAGPNAFSGLVLGTNQASACIKNYLDILSSGGSYAIIFPTPSGSVLLMEFSDSLCNSMTSAKLADPTLLANVSPSPDGSVYNVSVVPSAPTSFPFTGVVLTQHQQPGCTGRVTGFAAYAFNTACGVWGPPTDVHYLSCNATSYTVNLYSSDDGSCNGAPTQMTYPLGYWNGTGGGGSGPFDMNVFYSGASTCVSCYTPSAAQSAPQAPVSVQQYYAQWNGANYVAGLTMQTCAPMFGSNPTTYAFLQPIPNDEAIVNGTSTITAFVPGVLTFIFSDDACQDLISADSYDFSDPDVMSLPGTPGNISYVTAVPTTFPSASVVLTQYSQPGCTGQVLGYSAFALNSVCGVWGPPVDVHYLSCNATSYTVDLYPSDDGTCTGSPTQVTYPLNNWNGLSPAVGYPGYSGPFDLGLMDGYLCAACYVPPSPPSPSPPTPSPSPPPPPLPPPSPSPPPPSPVAAGTPPPSAPFVVAATMSLAGITPAQFTTQARTVWTSTVATSLNVSVSAITITGVTASTGGTGRHLLQSGIDVAFTVAAQTQASAASMSTAITAVTAAGAGSTAFLSALNTGLATVGAPAVTGVALTAAPAVTATPSPPPPAATSASPRAFVMHATVAAVAAAAVVALL